MLFCANAIFSQARRGYTTSNSTLIIWRRVLSRTGAVTTQTAQYFYLLSLGARTVLNGGNESGPWHLEQTDARGHRAAGAGGRPGSRGLVSAADLPERKYAEGNFAAGRAEPTGNGNEQ